MAKFVFGVRIKPSAWKSFIYLLAIQSTRIVQAADQLQHHHKTIQHNYMLNLHQKHFKVQHCPIEKQLQSQHQS